LEGPSVGLDGAKIVGCCSKKRDVIVRVSTAILWDVLIIFIQTVTPAQPAHFLFYLDSTNGPGLLVLETVVEWAN
jgi:hypothetical protein